MKRAVFYLVFAIPAVAVLMGMVTLYVAFSNADQVVQTAETPLSKTSWRDEPDDR